MLRPVASVVGLVLLAVGCSAPATDVASSATPAAAPTSVATATETPSDPAVATPSASSVLQAAPTPDGRYAELRARLARTVADPRYGGGAVAVSVLDGEGRPVYEHRAGAALMPASTVKLVTAAAALVALRPGYRYVTEVNATSAPGRDRTLDGDLVIVGSGDPALSTPLFDAEVWPDRPDTEMAELADRIAKRVRRITGDVIGDPSIFTGETLATGWLREYLYDLDATYVSGLTVNAGRRLERRNGRLVGLAVEDPAAEAAARLKGLLEERGVVIDGRARATPRPPRASFRLASAVSPPLSELLRWTVQHSDNHMADAIFRTIGAEVSGKGTWLDAASAVREVLDVDGLDWSAVHLADGSGLSRADRVTAGLLARIDVVMWNSSLAGVWTDLMAVAGESGTLRRRLRGTVAEGAFRGKTGTLDDVRAIVGSVTGPDARRFHLAVIANHTEGRVWKVRVLQDEIVLALAEHLRGCERRTLPPEPAPSGQETPIGPPPYELVRRGAA